MPVDSTALFLDAIEIKMCTFLYFDWYIIFPGNTVERKVATPCVNTIIIFQSVPTV